MSGLTVTILESEITIDKSWQPTMLLRWYRPFKYSSALLQQLWQCSDGTQEWRDIETITE
jgi:hypothetical protein